MITQESIEALKARLDIVDVVGTYLELKKTGANFKASCPFHDEKSASFTVSPSKQIFHCFGCGVGGDSIKFVMEFEKLNYPEALEKLANNLNFTLSYTEAKNIKPRSHLMQKVSEYYQKCLSSHQIATAYLKERGIYESSIETFGIGYAPDSFKTINFIKEHQFSVAEAVNLGVLGSEGNRLYARFIERITFPIYAPNATIVGFGGRTISGHQAKYVNSPETPFFNKSRLLYAYHLAKQEIYKKKEIIITEGYLDVVMLHQAGFTNTVATLGTALTNEHLPLLRKGEAKILMAYDGDKAGRAAALKASRLLSATGFSGGVVLFNDGVDPADMIQNGRVDELAQMLRHPKVFIEFVLDEILALYDLRDPKAREHCMDEGVGYLKTLTPFLQEEYKIYLASRLGGLGISPSLIKITAQTNQTNKYPNKQNVISEKHKDMWELTLIKTVLEYPQFLDMVLDVLDPSLLQFHSREFILVLQGRCDELMAIQIDESIVALQSEEELKAELILFLQRFYERELKKVNLQTSISFEQKVFLIRKLRGKIDTLKRGELVAFTS